MLHFTAVRYVLFIAPKSRMRSLKSRFVGLISKQKLEKNTMVPCGSLTKPLHGSSVGISTAGFILARHWMCPLPQHSNELSNRNTPRRFYHLLDWVGAYVPNCRHGTAAGATTGAGLLLLQRYVQIQCFSCLYFISIQKIREIFMYNGFKTTEKCYSMTHTFSSKERKTKEKKAFCFLRYPPPPPPRQKKPYKVLSNLLKTL